MHTQTIALEEVNWSLGRLCQSGDGGGGGGEGPVQSKRKHRDAEYESQSNGITLQNAEGRNILCLALTPPKVPMK